MTTMASPVRDLQIKAGELIKVAQSMPPAPRILAEVSDLLNDANSSVDEITTVLRRDTAMTTRVLRVSNSVTYAGESPVASLEEAIQRVGFGETYRIVGFAAAAQVGQRHLPFYGVTAAQFRENALLTALLMERLADLLGLDGRSAYTAGLLRSVGKLALDQICVARGDHDSYEADGRTPLLRWETERCGLDNVHAAKTILATWRFPVATINAINEHYSPGADAPILARLLNVAAAAADRCGHGWPGEWSYWSQAMEQAESLRLTEENLNEATRDALEAFGPVRAAVG